MALCGIAFAATNASNRYQDLGWLRGSGLNGIRLISAKAHLREEIFAIIKLILALVIGIIAMTLPPALSSEGRVLGFIVAICIVGIEVFIVLGSMFRFQERRRLIRDLAHLEMTRPQRSHHKPKEL